MSDYISRLMLESDLDEVIKLVQGASDFAWTPQNIQQSYLSDNDESFVFTLADEAELLGYAVIHTVLDESQLLNIAIRKDQQGRGLGILFLQQLIKHSRQHNQSSLALEVRASNAPAISLYEKYGFQKNGTRKAYYKAVSGREDAWLYSLSLS